MTVGLRTSVPGYFTLGFGVGYGRVFSDPARGRATASVEVAPALGKAPIPLREAQYRLGLDAGLGTGLVAGALTFGYAPRPWFWLEAGLGDGVLGLTPSATARFALGSNRDRFLLGVGLAASLDTVPAGTVLWSRFDLGLRDRDPTGWAVGVVGGLAMVLSGCERLNSPSYGGACADSMFERGRILPHGTAFLARWY